MRGVYAWICLGCDHPSNRHTLTPGLPIEGPYACHWPGCDCLKMRDDPDVGITRAEFEARYPRAN